MKRLGLFFLSMGIVGFCNASWEAKEKLRAYSYKAAKQMDELKDQLMPPGSSFKDVYKYYVKVHATHFFSLVANPDVTVNDDFLKDSMHFENVSIQPGLHADAFTDKVIDNKSVVDIAQERKNLMCYNRNDDTNACKQAQRALEQIMGMIKESQKLAHENQKVRNYLKS